VIIYKWKTLSIFLTFITFETFFSENIFKCGISTAPPTDWLLYRSDYVERYMGLPTENENWVNNININLTLLKQTQVR
jgi:dipeptidyl aminopeptidase/acylaminoacyl peptidase